MTLTRNVILACDGAMCVLPEGPMINFIGSFGSYSNEIIEVDEA